jgi:hypothetical protein
MHIQAQLTSKASKLVGWTLLLANGPWIDWKMKTLFRGKRTRYPWLRQLDGDVVELSRGGDFERGFSVVVLAIT